MSRGRCSLLLAVGLFPLLLPSLTAQLPTASPGGIEPIRLFLDCHAAGCQDTDFLRTEIQFVDWVRDQGDADVHLLVTFQSTGAGGRSYDFFFLGLGRFEGRADTLTYVAGFDATTDEERSGVSGVIKIGLMRYVGLTGLADRIVIGMRGPPPPGPGGAPSGPQATAAPEDDPWDFWVFRTSLSGYGMGESTYKSFSLNGSFTASRTTEEWKASLGLRTGYNESRYDYETLTTKNITRSHSFSGLLARSLTDHWSVGVRGGASSSTYANNRFTVEAAPVLEYNFFPYSESTRRMFTFVYALEASHVDYVEETVFFKTAETVLRENLTASLDLTQPWGSASVYLGGGHLLRDVKLHNANVGGSVRVRVARGLSVSVSGSVSRIQDRISVPAGEATVEDVLLRRRQLQTDYSFFSSVSLSYTFGSIFNNVVNPRLGGTGGEGVMIMY